MNFVFVVLQAILNDYQAASDNLQSHFDSLQRIPKKARKSYNIKKIETAFCQFISHKPF